MMIKPLARAYSHTSSSGRPIRPHSRTCALPGKSVLNKPGSLGERFSSKSNFMRHDVQTAITVRGKCEARLNVVGSEVRKILQHLGNGHAATEIVENVGYRDTCAADAGFATADTRVDGNPLSVIHNRRVVFWGFRVKEARDGEFWTKPNRRFRKLRGYFPRDCMAGSLKLRSLRSNVEHCHGGPGATKTFRVAGILIS